MPKIRVNNQAEVEVAENKRLVLAIEETGVNIGHRCGGFARCTTCRVTFSQGEPDTYSEAEYKKLSEANLLGQARLSCQILCSHDMAVTPLMTKETEGWGDTGPAPQPVVTPEPAVFHPRSYYEGSQDAAQQASELLRQGPIFAGGSENLPDDDDPAT